jgi:hypothetical protein
MANVLIVRNRGKWYSRRVRCVEHRLDVDEKVYHCDQPLTGPHKTAEQALRALRDDGWVK